MADAAAIPYLDLAVKGWSAAYSTKLAGLGELKLGVFAGQAKSSPFEDNSYYDPSRDPNVAGIYGGTAEFTVPVGEKIKVFAYSSAMRKRADTFEGETSNSFFNS